MQVKSGLADLPFLDLSGTSGCAAYQFRRTSRAVARLYDTALAPSGIRSTQFALLTAIAKLEPVAISRVAEILVIDLTTMTRSLKLLEKEGLVEIAPRGVRRRRLLTLTSKAEKALAAAVPLWRRMQARFLAELGGKWPDVRGGLEQAAQVVLALEAADSTRDSQDRTKRDQKPG